jgi:DNA-binding transcriptional MerR regulator/methylmalonyl-CoA mutase cobalamin-binding subunit
MNYTEPRHPINFVSRRTGLSAHLIRAWEKRYRAVVPQRTQTNRRLYSDADIDRLKSLSRLITLGHSIGQIAGLDGSRLEAIAGVSQSGRTEPVRDASVRESTDSIQEILQRAQSAVAHTDGDALFGALTDANVRLPQPVLLSDVIGPLLTWIGNQWHSGALRIAGEHLASSVLRDFLSDLRRKNRPPAGAPTLVVATPSAEPHEFGALMAAISAASDGWHDVYLGPNTPWQEIATVARDTNARAVALSLSYPGDNPEVRDELEKLRQYLPESIRIFVGGAGAATQRASLEDVGLSCVDSLEQFRAGLAALRG